MPSRAEPVLMWIKLLTSYRGMGEGAIVRARIATRWNGEPLAVSIDPIDSWILYDNEFRLLSPMEQLAMEK